MTSAGSVDEVLDLYERFGEHHYDEELSQLAHALQTAALAEAAGASDELIAASLLHDVGHLLEIRDTVRTSPAGGDLHHEATGVAYVAGLFHSSVTRPIAFHVRAKRYRCAVDTSYFDALSAGSKASLAKQGGPMTETQAREFERVPWFADAMQLREWDDLGKVDGLAVPGLDHYRPLLDDLAP